MDRFQNTRQPDWDWWGRLWPTPGATLRELGVSGGTSVLEVGSGNGYFALPAARIATPAPVYALDLDASLLGELDRLADRQGIENVVTVRGDARALSTQIPDPVDLVLIANTFHGIDGPDAFLGEVDAVLAPGGRFVVVNWEDRPREETTVDGEPRGPPTDRRLSPEATERAVLRTVDWTLARQVDLPPYHYALCFER